LIHTRTLHINGSHDNPGDTVLPPVVTEFSDDDRWFHPQDFSHNDRWETAQELCATNASHAPLAYSNNNTLTSDEAGEKADYQ
jgi:hypothetical protein